MKICTENIALHLNLLKMYSCIRVLFYNILIMYYYNLTTLNYTLLSFFRINSYTGKTFDDYDYSNFF